MVIITIALVCIIFESLQVFDICAPLHNYISLAESALTCTC